MNLQNLDIKDLVSKEDWSLFIDRDGVINVRIIDNYVKKPSEFVFIDGSLEAIVIFKKLFYPILVVTNQQGIGKGLMSIDDLSLVHKKMNDDIVKAGGKINKIYFCPDLANSNSKNRKPEIGMALQAKLDFPEIDFKKSIMVGDSISDMKFGKNARMKTVFIGDKNIAVINKDIIDYSFSSLLEFAKRLT